MQGSGRRAVVAGRMGDGRQRHRLHLLPACSVPLVTVTMFSGSSGAVRSVPSRRRLFAGGHGRLFVMETPVSLSSSTTTHFIVSGVYLSLEPSFSTNSTISFFPTGRSIDQNS